MSQAVLNYFAKPQTIIELLHRWSQSVYLPCPAFFYQIKNIIYLPCSFHLVISSCISLTGIILAATWADNQRCEAYFIMLYLRAAFWLITYVSVPSTSKPLITDWTFLPNHLPAFWPLCQEPSREAPSRWVPRFPSVHRPAQGRPAADRFAVEYVPASDPDADSALLRR